MQGNEATNIPCLNLEGMDAGQNPPLDRLARDLDEALRGCGFVAVRGLVSPRVRDAAFTAARGFFAASGERKVRFAYGSAADNFGYQGIEGEALDPGGPGDLKETFTMRDVPGHRSIPGRWPSPGFRDASEDMYLACMAGAQLVLRAFALALGVSPDYFAERHHGENTTLRLLHYPPRAGGSAALGATADDDGQSPVQLGAGAHTDYGSITLLFQDRVPGLQIQGRDGGWLNVPPRPETVLINTGDLMAHWSNDRYPSSCHRVVPPSGDAHRYSIAFFADPDSDVPVSCLPSCVSAARPARYPDTTAGEHIQARIRASHT